MDEEKAKRREGVIRKIRALLSMTVERGASEAEALKAAEMAAKLMAEHDLDMDDLSAREAGVDEGAHPVDPAFARHMPRVSAAIAELCGVKTWGKRSRSGKPEQVFFGLPHDVEVAVYLQRICERAIADGLKKASVEWALRVRRKAALDDSYLSGMSRRLAERIREIAWTRARSTGTALVPVKDALIEQAMKDRGIELETERLLRRDIDPLAFARGVKEAEKVALNAAVGGSAEPDGKIGS
jgi:Protein of unknown function (DUF2786).